jgi:hypothetical protein
VLSIALERGAAKLASPMAAVEVIASAVQRLPESGITLHRFTLMSRANGGVALVDLDERGRERDERSWVEAERLARLAKHGRLDETLERAVARMEQGERRWVVVHVPFDDGAIAGAGSNLLRDPGAAEAEQRRVAAILREGVATILAMLPPNTRFAWPGEDSPFLSLHLSAAEIRLLSRSNAVGRLYDGENQGQVPLGCTFEDANHQSVELDPYNQYSVTNTTTAHQAGLLGTGIKVANMFDTVCDYPTLPFNPFDSTHARVPLAASCPGMNHGSEVMGYLANTNPYDPESPSPGTTKGMCPGAELFWAGVTTGSDPEWAGAYVWLRQKGIKLATMSVSNGNCYGTCSPPTQPTWDAIADYYATHSPFILQIAGAGNGIDPAAPYGTKVLNQLHNGIVVAASTPCQSPNLPCDMSRAASQSVNGWVYENPAPEYLEVGDHELPHMAAPGAYLRISLDDPGGCGGAGTSFASPILAGAAALVAQKNTLLYGRPEALKAVLMAGADVNTDINTPSLSGGPFSYQPRYNTIGLGTGVDRHGGVGLANTDASVTIGQPSERMRRDDRAGLSFAYALANTSATIQTYQQGLPAPTAVPDMNGHDFGVMDPTNDFDSIWWKHFYYFQPTQSGSLRIVLTWNRPYNCTFTPTTTTCGPDYKPDLNMLLRDLDAPTTAVGVAASYDPNEEFISAPVVAGKVYRLDVYKQNYWPGAESFAVAAYLTTSPQ